MSKCKFCKTSQVVADCPICKKMGLRLLRQNSQM